MRGAERDECWDDTPLEGVFELPLELGSDVRILFVSKMGGCGDLDIWDCRYKEGKDKRDVLELTALPLELVVPFVGGRLML